MGRLQHCARVLSLLNHIGGERVAVSGGASISVVEPATGGELTLIAESGADAVAAAVGSAASAFDEWRGWRDCDRRRVLQRVAQLIRENLEDIAYWEVRDTGKPMREARVDIGGCADTFDYFAAASTSLVGDCIPLGDWRRRAYTHREPLGVCAGIGAWNYPFQTASWKVAPALAAGNAFVYKPSPLAPVTAVMLAQLVVDAGAPRGLVNVLQGGAETGRALCLDDAVRKVSFTGSVPTGQRIMQMSAERGLKPVTLELGGKSPLLIFADAHLDNAVTGALLANFLTQGEVCSNASRVFVHRSIFEEFSAKLVARTAALKVGNPLNSATTVGAMISQQHMEKVEGFIRGAVQQGARVLLGGERVTPADADCADGFFLSPCVLDKVDDSMTIVREEVFGAVLTLLPFDTDDEAIARANATPYGLAAGLFTLDLRRAQRVAAELQAGSVYVNTFNDFDAAVPFGGVKLSGFGRENGVEALRHYTQLKSVYVDASDHLADPFR